jgi:hypothetical protein
MPDRKVLVLGGNFAGLTAALSLKQKLRDQYETDRFCDSHHSPTARAASGCPEPMSEINGSQPPLSEGCETVPTGTAARPRRTPH